MRTTLTVDDELLIEAKVIAARTHRTIGSVVEDALRSYLDQERNGTRIDTYELPVFLPERPGLQPGVDLHDKELRVLDPTD